MILLSARWAVQAQPRVLKHEFLTDMAYEIIASSYAVILGYLVTVILAQSGYVDGSVEARLAQGAAPVNQVPAWLSVLLLFLVGDFLQYWLHRWTHRGRLWDFHAVHHAPQQLDWHHAVRFHPVNYFVYIMPVKLLFILAGVPVWQVFVLGPLSVLYSVLLHANLNFTFGPLRYVLASPVFHRWHHSAEPEARDKNFAPTFPFYDLLFGTFYMPKDRLPGALGIAGNPVPKGIVGQMVYPFRRGRAK